MSLIDTRNFNEVVFAKETKKHIIITRGERIPYNW